MEPDLSGAMNFFDVAMKYVDAPSFQHELQHQRNAVFDNFDESDLLRETAWVVLCSGFREATVRKMFNYISLCFCDWESAELIVDSYEVCRATALSRFGHEKKINAIITVARIIEHEGFDAFKRRVLDDPMSSLLLFPYIGKITARHLAKNLGLDVAKPDRHLVRITQQFGFTDTDQLCSSISKETGQPIKVVDLVIWRYAADNKMLVKF